MTSPASDPRIARGMRAQLQRRRALIAAGDRPLGWKVGFGVPAAMEKLGITAPLVGFLMRSARVPSGGEVSLADWTRPVVEPEIAVHLGRDIAAGADPATVRAAIAGLGPAIELADLDHPPDDVETILAGNIYQRRVVLGAPDPTRAGANVDGLVGRVIRRGIEAASTGRPQALTGDLVDIVRHVADLLAAFGERLKAKDVIIAGSVVPPIWAEPDENAIGFVLEPIGSVSVRLKA